jgi:hypothetical protein
MVGLRAAAQRARLDLDEVADVHVVLERRARPQARVRADPRVIADLRALEMQNASICVPRPTGHVAQHAIRADARAVVEAHAALEHAADVDRDGRGRIRARRARSMRSGSGDATPAAMSASARRRCRSRSVAGRAGRDR